jgi:hypothetical protein
MIEQDIETRPVHMIVSKRIIILDQPIPENEVWCPDCGCKEGKGIIFEPKDGPERVWWCFRCQGKVPRSRHWMPKGGEGSVAKEWPQVHYNLSDKFR